MLKEMIWAQAEQAKNTRLNPYFNGTCSKRLYENAILPSRFDVLILILMEHAQRGST